MGKMKEKPRYNLLSVRVDDELDKAIREAVRGYDSVSEFLLAAIHEKLIADGELLFRDNVRARIRRAA